MKFDRKELSNDHLLKLYKEILLPRMVEEKMLVLLRQGKISKWFSGIGQEAVSVGVSMGLQSNDYILPMHRNLGVFTSRNVPLFNLFCQFQGKASGFTKGRDRSFHFGTNEHHIVGMISHLGSQMGVADGIALGEKLKTSNQITAVFSGDGGSSEGDFHESINVAAVWDLPVMIIIENNGYGLSTPSSQQFKFNSFVDKAKGYGIKGIQLDGNNVLEVYNGIVQAAEKIRKNHQPILVECMTFRMRGHEEASGTKYVPKELMEKWAKKDPIENYEKYLLKEKVITTSEIEKIKKECKSIIDSEWKKSVDAPVIEPDLQNELDDVFKAHQFSVTKAGQQFKNIRMVDAISEGLTEAMDRHDNLVLMGQDIADYGGVFKITEGFLGIYGEERVRNTPLCEAAIVGTALGLSVKGFKSMVEMQFADFVSEGFNQIINNLAKIHWRWGQHADVVIRMPTGAGVAAGPFHSQSNEAWFTHTPGLKVVYPAFPAEAKGLLLASFEDPNPVMFFEHKGLYRSCSEDVAEGYYTEEIGKAKVRRQGNDVSVITYGMGVHWALEILDELQLDNVDLIDLQTLAPLDVDTIYNSVQKTGRVIVLHEDTMLGGLGGEISALIAENCFEYLDAPVVRSASLDTPVPFISQLENQFLPKERFKEQLTALLDY